MEELRISRAKPSFEEFYSTYHDTIVWYIEKKISHRENAEDLAGEVFMYCFKNYESFDPSLSSPATWLYLITNSRVKNYYRDFKNTMDIEHFVGSLHDDRIDMDMCIYVEQLRNSLEKAMEQLNDTQRTIVRMRYFEDRSPGEIGMHLGLTSVNVRVQLSRALKKLRGLCSHILEGEK